MRLIDELSDKPLRYVLMMLTPSEAKDLIGALEGLINDYDPMDHVHVSDREMAYRLTLAVYTPESTKYYHKRVQRLLLEET